MFKAFSFLLFFMTANIALAETSIIDHVQKLQSSLVLVHTVYTKIAADKTHSVSYERTGSGIIIDAHGLIVTNTHTIINAPHIFVILHNGKKVEADVVFANVEYDFSLLRIQPPFALKAISWADSSQVKIGEQIIAVGSSDVNNQSILSGVITGLVQSQSTGDNELLETNLNLYKGDSGGPILNQYGHLLGIVRAKSKTEENTSYAIASNTIRKQYIIYKNRNLQ